MIPTVVLDRAATPGGEMVLSRHGDDFAIRVGGVELMSSRAHGSEDQLGAMTCARVASLPHPAVLVGGLGLGFTLRAVLDALPRAAVDVVELVPAIVRWNREVLGHLAGRPLDDPRVTVHEGDVGDVIRRRHRTWTAIVLDVDNGPDALFAGNAGLYRKKGLTAAFDALAPGGVLAVWSAFRSPEFTSVLSDVGFDVETATIRAHGRSGARHTLWFGRRPPVVAPRGAQPPLRSTLRRRR